MSSGLFKDSPDFRNPEKSLVESRVNSRGFARFTGMEGDIKPEYPGKSAPNLGQITGKFLTRLSARLLPAYIELHQGHAPEYMASRPDLIFREVTGDNPNHRYFAVRLRSVWR